jgi:hypothetical protein
MAGLRQVAALPSLARLAVSVGVRQQCGCEGMRDLRASRIHH